MNPDTAIRLYKGVSIEKASAAAVALAREVGATSLVKGIHMEEANEMTRISFSSESGILTVSGGTDDRADVFMREFGMSLFAPCIECRIQEASYWDYVSFQGRVEVDKFSTLPESWTDDPAILQVYAGDPELLALFWGRDRTRIEKYLRNWGMIQRPDYTHEYRLTGLAYGDDLAPYGDPLQMFDFARTLGYTENWRYHLAFRLPDLNYAPARHFLSNLNST